MSTYTAAIKTDSLALSFKSRDTSFLDPLTSINITLSSDGNGNWSAIIIPNPVLIL